MYKKLFERGVGLVFLNERYIDTDVYAKAKENLVPMTGGDVDVILQGVNAYLMRLAERQVHLACEQAQKERDDLADFVKGEAAEFDVFPFKKGSGPSTPHRRGR